MRISAKEKEETRLRILEEGHLLFLEKGYEQTTTRDIAAATGLATGTLFNYFPNKESLAMTVLGAAFQKGGEVFQSRLDGDETLEEELFSHIAAEMRELRPYRGFVGEVLETAFSPFGTSQVARSGDDARERHLICVRNVLGRHGQQDVGNAVTLHLYWTLYLGVLAFWSKDNSPKQEDSLSVLDQSIRLFASTMSSGGQTPRK